MEPNSYIENRSKVLFDQQYASRAVTTSRFFAILMLFQWLAAITWAFYTTPYTWIGDVPFVHEHVKQAIYFGFLLTAVPVWLTVSYPSSELTKHLITACQMLWSGLLIHLSNGRIETHFHVFGSLAFIAFYKDWRLLITATIITSMDHVVRGMFWPQSVYGVVNSDLWRTFEHAGWVVFENIFLIFSTVRGVRDMKSNTRHQASLEFANKITQRKIQEEEILRADLQRALEKAEAASIAKGAFLANMSHEIRTPLNGIFGALHIVSKGNLDDEQRQFIKIASHSCQSLGSLINDVLDFSKIESGKLELFEEFFDLRELTEDIIGMQLPKAEEKGIILTSFITAAVPETIYGDRTRLGQVLTNLISNAVKFTQYGFVIVEVDCIETKEECCSLRFEIRDSGMGIAAEKQSALFEPFIQADASTTKEFGGTGLGLAICKQIISQMKGQIGVESEAGTGSTFWFQISAKRNAEDQETNRYFTLDKTNIRVLFLHKNNDHKEVLFRQLSTWGFQTVEATTLPEIHDAVSKTDRAFTVILVTPDALSELTTFKNGSNVLDAVPTALIAGMKDCADYARALQAKIIHEIVRPLRQSTLFDTIISLIAVSRGYRNTKTQKELLPIGSIIDFSDKKILLAEDNHINQIIARALLREYNIEPFIVANGHLAIDAMAIEEFDLIFMDCHMPVMDGFTAANLIRKQEASEQKAAHVPIVALTADVSIETQEKCRQVGIDAYISKPLDPEKLRAVLKQMLAMPLIDVPLINVVAPSAEVDCYGLPVIDLADLVKRFGNNQELMNLVLSQFETQIRESCLLIHQAIAANNHKQLFQHAHALKGACSAAGAMTLREVCNNLESIGRNGKTIEQNSVAASLNVAANCLQFLADNGK